MMDAILGFLLVFVLAFIFSMILVAGFNTGIDILETVYETGNEMYFYGLTGVSILAASLNEYHRRKK